MDGPTGGNPTESGGDLTAGRYLLNIKFGFRSGHLSAPRGIDLLAGWMLHPDAPVINKCAFGPNEPLGYQIRRRGSVDL